MERVRARGVEIAEITLHVGYGTFEPVRVDDLSQHAVMAERYTIDKRPPCGKALRHEAGPRIVAVGTTTTRALESNIRRIRRHLRPAAMSAELTITPGYKFRAVDALLTNFHLPQSSLLVLTSTFGGHELIMSAYRHAVASDYRFYSYGDCMLISLTGLAGRYGCYLRRSVTFSSRRSPRTGDVVPAPRRDYAIKPAHATNTRRGPPAKYSLLSQRRQLHQAHLQLPAERAEDA